MQIRHFYHKEVKERVNFEKNYLRDGSIRINILLIVIKQDSTYFSRYFDTQDIKLIL